MHAVVGIGGLACAQALGILFGRNQTLLGAVEVALLHGFEGQCHLAVGEEAVDVTLALGWKNRSAFERGVTVLIAAGVQVRAGQRDFHYVFFRELPGSAFGNFQSLFVHLSRSVVAGQALRVAPILGVDGAGLFIVSLGLGWVRCLF